MATYYNRDGQPMTMMEWAVKFEDLDYKRVALTEVGPFEVSTVWLGTDLGGEDRPLIFETIVFGSDNERMTRYPTLDEAERGHAAIVAELQA
jgi:hypothetical protein